MTFLTILGVIEILIIILPVLPSRTNLKLHNLCSFRLVLDGRTHKEIPKSSRLEFLEKLLASNFLLSEFSFFLYAEENASGSLNRGGTAELPL